MKLQSVTVILGAMALSSSAFSDVIVNSVAGVSSATQWGTLPGENSATGMSAVTSTAARSGLGSLEINGDRVRAQLGIQYSPFTTNLGPLSAVTGLSFDWRIAGDSISGYNPDYTPALRLLVQDGTQRSELIWEGVYNNTYGNTSRNTWYSTTFGDLFYQNVAGSGVTLSGGSQVNKTLQQWIAQNFSANAFVSGISVGVGSGALSTYHGFVDNVTIGRTSGNTTYNFEPAAPVPEPSTWAAMTVGVLGFGASRRRKAAAKRRA